MKAPSQNEIAKQLGISGPTFSAQVARGCPANDLQAAQAWRKANLNPAKTKGTRLDAHRVIPTDIAGETFEQARTRKTVAEANLVEFEEATLREKYVLKFEVEAAMFFAGRQLRDNMTNCARRLGAEVAGLRDAGECEAVIHREHRAFLADFALTLRQKIKIEAAKNPLNAI